MAGVSLFSFMVGSVRSVIGLTLNIIKSFTINQRMLTYGLGLSLSITSCIFLVCVVGNLIIEATGYGLSRIEKLKKRQGRRRNLLISFDKASLFLMAGALIGGVQQATFGTTYSFVSSLFSSFLIEACIGLIMGFGYVMVNYWASILPSVTIFYQNIMVPISYMVIITGTLIAIIAEAVMPIVSGWHKFITSIPFRLFTVAISCFWEIFTEAIQLLAGFIYALVAAIIQWIVSNPLQSELPLGNAVNYLGQFVSLVGVQAINCSCAILRWVVGGLFEAFAEPNFGDLVESAFNFAWVSLNQILILPVLSIVGLFGGGSFLWPSFYRPFELYISTLDFGGRWLQNVTTDQFDIYFTGGNGTLVSMVNGTLPMPTNDWQYLVRWLQSQWAQFGLRFASYILGPQLIWQVAFIAQNLPSVFQSDGNSVAFDLTRTYNEGMFVYASLGTVLNIPGTCTPKTNYTDTPFSQLSTPVAVVVGAFRLAWDCIFGEIYTSISTLTFPGIFTKEYLQTSPVKVLLQQNVEYMGVGYGCLFAYIDSHLGTTFQGITETLVYWLWAIPVEFIVNVRAVFGGSPALILDDIEVGALEISMLKIATLGGFLFQFEPGANEAVCVSRVTLICNLGLFIMQAMSVLIRVVVVLINILVQFIKFITGSIQQNAVQNIIIPPDIACDPTLTATAPQTPGANCKMVLVEDIYDAGCRLGVVLGNVIPIDIPCVTGIDNFCYVHEFPDVRPNTFTKCTATFMCKVGRWLGIIPDFFFTLFNWVVNFQWTTPSDSTTGADNQFLINMFKKVMNLVIYGVLGPLCPFAHVLDCLWSLLPFNGNTGSGSTDKPASAIICLVTAFVVVFVRDIGDLIIAFLRIVIFFLSLIFGVQVVANNLAEIGQLLTDFFTIFGETLKKIFMLLLTFILSGLFAFLQNACELIKKLDNSLDCSVLSSTLDDILTALGTTPIDSPDNINYKKRDATFGTTTQTWTKNCTSFFRSPEYAKMFHLDVLNGFPKGIDEVCSSSDPTAATQPPTRPVPVHEQFRPLQTPTAYGSFERDKRAGIISDQIQLNVMQTLIMRQFGPGPENPDDLPGYMHRNVYWKPDSTCHFLFTETRTSKVSQLGPADRLLMADCIRLKMVAVTISTVFPFMSWLPEDIFYNMWSAFIGLFTKLAHLMLVILQFAVDRHTPPNILLTASYQNKWTILKLNITFYNDTLLPLFEKAVNSTAGAQAVQDAVNNMTVMSYIHRNFPSLYFTNAKGEVEFKDTDPLLEPFRGFLDYTYQVAKEAATGAGISADQILKFRNSTYAFYFNYTADRVDVNDTKRLAYWQRPEFVHYQGQYYDYHNRTQLLLGLGEDVVRAIDGYRSTKSLYGYIGRLADMIVDWSMNRTQSLDGLGSNARNGSWLSWTTIPWDQYFPADPKSPNVNKRYAGEEFLHADGDADKMGMLSAAYNAFFEVQKVPRAVVENGSRIMQHIRDGMRARLESLFQSPAYENELTPFGSMVAMSMNVLYKAIGGNESRVLPPWCVAKAARAHSMSFAEVRQNITFEDCEYYDRLSFRGNYTYDQFKKEYYRTALNGDLIRAEPTEEEKKSFLEKVFAPMNADAVRNRQAVGMLIDSVGREVWNYGYLFLGDEGTAAERMVKIILDQHPSFEEYRKTHNVYEQMLKMMPGDAQERIKRTGHTQLNDLKSVKNFHFIPGIKAFFNMTERFREAAMVRQALNNEQIIRSSKYASIMEHQRKIRNTLLGIDTGKEYRELQEMVKKAYRQMQLEAYSANFANDPRGRTLLDSANPATLFIENLPGGLDILEFFSPHCYTTQLWLCQECWIVDATLGRVLQIVNAGLEFYTDDFPIMLEEQAAIINYYELLGSQNVTNPPVYIGNSKTCQPRFPNLGDPIGNLMQFSANETANGLDWFIWFYQIIGIRLDGLIQNGTCYNDVYNYNITADMTGSANSNLALEFLRIVQIDLGLDVCGVIDTVMFIVNNCVPNIVTWIVDHVFLCNYTDHLNGKARNYSLSAGLIVVGVILLVLFLATTLVFYFSGTLTTLIMSGLVLVTPAFFLIIVYNWCFLCFPLLPDNLIDDILHLVVYTPTIVGPCSIIIGTFVNDTTYNNIQCTNANITHTFANGADLGFTNPLNNLQFAQTAYGTTWNISQYVVPVWSFLFGQSTPTYTYDDYHINPIRAANYTGYFILSSVFLFFPLVLLMGWITLLFVFALVGNIYVLFQSVIIAFFAFLKFIESIL